MRHVKLDGNNTVVADFEAPQPDAFDALGNLIAKGIPTVPMEETDPRYVAYKNPPPLGPDDFEQAALAALNGVGSAVDPVRLLKAMVISAEAYRLGKAPGLLTAQELLAALRRIAAIYKAV